MNNKLIDSELNEYLFEILDQAKNGITITDPNKEDNPIIYVNQTFTNLFEYQYNDIIGFNCRFLQGEDREQKSIEKIRDAIEKQIPTTVILRNYTKSGKLIFNELTISPIFDKSTQKIKYFLGVQKDVTKEQNLLKELSSLI